MPSCLEKSSWHGTWVPMVKQQFNFFAQHATRWASPLFSVTLSNWSCPSWNVIARIFTGWFLSKLEFTGNIKCSNEMFLKINVWEFSLEIRNTFKNISLTFLYLCRKINFTQMNNDLEMHNMGHKTLVFYSLVIKSFSIQLIAKGKGKVLASRCQKVFKPWYCFIFQILLLLFVVGSEIFCVQFVTTIKKKCISAPWQWWSWGGIFKNYHRNFRLHIRHRCIFAIHLTSGPLRKKHKAQN